MKKISCIVFALSYVSVLLAQSPDLYYLKGMAALQQNQYEDALISLTDAIDRNNSDEQFYLSRAEALYKLGKFDLAARDYEEANNILPRCGDMGLARIYATTGDVNKAIQYLTSHLQSDFRLPESAITKDPAFDPLQQTNEWHNLWQQDWYSDFEKAEAEVEYLLRKKNPEGALEYLDNNKSSYQTKAKYYALRAQVYLIQENYAAAVADYSMALSLDKTEPEFYFNRGLAFLKSASYRNAIEDITKGLRYEPARFAFYLERAKAYAGLLDYKSAIGDLETYLTYFTDDRQAISLCGEMCYQNDDYLNALKYFNKNLKSDPINPEYFKARGKTYLKTKTYTYAINDLSMALDLKPDDGETYLYLGLAKLETGDKEDGCSDLQKAQQYGNTMALKYCIEYCGK